MKKFVLKNILAVSVMMALGHTAVYADDNLPSEIKKIQRSFVNLGFERLIDGATPNKNSCQNQTQNSTVWSAGYCLFDQKWVEGWKTTASFFEGTTNHGHREIELWKQGGAYNGPTAHQGKIYAELNAHTAAALYQNVCISEDDKLTWSLQHHVRDNASSERLKFMIADEIVDNNLSSAIQPTNKSYLTNQRGETEFVSTKNWTRHYQDTPIELKNYLGGKKAGIKAFAFEGAGGTATVGNWLDSIELKLKPAVEFSAENGTVQENDEGKLHSVNFNVIGLITGDVKVGFIIDTSVVDNPAQHRGLDSEVGDYKIYDTSSGTPVEIIPEVDPKNPKILRFQYTIKYNSNLNYDTGVVVKGLAIQVYNNGDKDGNRVVPFELDKDSTEVAVMDLSECGGRVFSGFKYEIQDDDIDLVATKSIINESSLLKKADQKKVSYAITVFNDSSAIAKDVVLKDALLTNLTIGKDTTLACEVISSDIENISCPQLSKDSVTQLFDKGINLGDLLGQAHYKFTLSDLSLNSEDTSPTDISRLGLNSKDYLGYIANKVIVSSADDNAKDVDISNNSAIAKNLYPAKFDLMNADNSSSGQGLFVIDKDGKALWEQTAQDNKVYFPLKIQNTAKLEQDYQLYASRKAIEAVSNDQEFSPLKTENIVSYTDELKVEFYDAKDGSCNAQVKSFQQVSQIKVAPESTRELCAVISIYPSAKDKYDIWFAIESIQTGLGDIIRDAVTSVPFVQRLLELLNDQKAQVNVGGSFVFLHRLLNHGTEDEKDISLQLVPVNGDDGFLYSLFVDTNNDGQLDAKDEMVTSLDQKYSLGKTEVLQLLVKVQSPATATNGMMSQIKLEAIPSNENQSIFLESLINTDTVFVGSDQVQVTKTQFKRENCTAMSADEIEKAKYTVSSQTIGANDCLIYKISIKNTGSEVLKNIDVNDMYPAYTHKWELGQNILPMTSSGEVVEVKGDQVKTTILELLPQQEKSLYFGIKLN